MEKNSLKRALAVIGIIAVIAVVGFLAFFKSPPAAGSKTTTEKATNAGAPAQRVEADAAVGPRKERIATAALEYRDVSGGPGVKVALDEIALMDADGKTSIVKLDPPATAGTLGARMKNFTAAQGVMPIAYVEDKEKIEVNRRYVTNQIRAKMPQEQAERIAKKHGLRIFDRPSYAPEWVVFSTEQPLEALEKIDGLRGEGFVESADVLLASYMTKKVLPSDPLVGTQWHIKKTAGSSAGTDVNIEDTWGYGTAAGDERRGQGIVVGIIDDGLETGHPDLAPNVSTDTSLGFDYNGNDSDPNPGIGDNHGTACAGLTAARGNNGIGVAGTAPAATLVGLRLIAGPVTDLKTSQAMSRRNEVVFVKSNSWGPSDSGEGLDAPGPLTLSALSNSAATGRNGKGTIFVWAGGNGGRASTQDNSNYDGYANSIYTIAIGATNSNGGRSDYSEPGANLVVCAPSSGAGGLGIVTTDNTGSAGYNTAAGAAGNYTNTFGGTSAATPEVSGVIALMLKENPNLGWRDVQEILIRSAKKILPGDADWKDNSAGYHFNHNFGAGLVDATAAVAMSNPATWVNLGTQTSVVSTQSGLGADIPNNNATGIIRQFSIPTSNIRTEHATLRLSITHASRGELEISLTSPSGMVSRLAEVRSDPNADYTDWTFGSTRTWGELSSGTWTLKIADRSNTNRTVGHLTFAELKVFGASAAPVNPAPVVSITSPLTGSLSSPGVAIPVEVSAVDFDLNGDPSTVSKVELFANNVLIGTDTVAPYSFIHSPPNGNVIYLAKATDIEAKFANSAPVTVTVVNQTPAITDVTQNANGQLFADSELKVTSVSANDPENTPVTLAYQWQSSIDETTFLDLAGAVGAALPVSASNAGKIWRCRITASDGNTTSVATFTAPVNILLRPATFAQPGATYSYQSGLVLKGFETVISRQAIIHEFSHGNGGGNSQWAEILVMQTGSFRNWQFRDATGRSVRFRNTAVWDAIPAGTLLVLYNGSTTKNSLLPADTTDASSGTMVISSADTIYFDTVASTWPSFGSSGGSLFLFDGAGATVHSLSYGSSTDASPNIGTVSAETAAFYFGDSDAGADNARNWLKTSSNTARFIRTETEAEMNTGEKSLNPLAAFTGGRYDQNFNTAPGAFGTNYPAGWTSFRQPLINQVVNDENMTVGNGSETTAGNFNYGSQIGIRGGDTFDPGSLVLGLADTNGLTNLKISYDVLKVNEQPRNMSFILEYSTGNPVNSSTVWTQISGGNYASGSSSSGTRTRFENIALPAIFNNRPTGSSSKIYLRWRYESSSVSPGSGARDALALDNVLISSAQSPNILLGLSLAPSTVSEISGTAASLATVTISDVPTADLTIQLISSDTTSATVPASVVILAGQLSATFPIATLNNTIPDGTRAVTISVAAAGFVTVSKILTVTDDEAPVNGVTPGKANSGSNELFVTRLRTNNLNDPPRYGIAAGSTLPTGLSINPDTGLISGTISPSAATGSYPITVNLTNIVGDITSQSFTLSLTATGGATFEAFIAGFDLADSGPNGDSDFDQIPNLVEYKLNSLPGTFDQPSPILTERSATEISITYSRATNRDDVSLVAEWNTTLESSGWQTAGITETILATPAGSQTVKSSLPIAAGDAKRFIRLRAVKVVAP